MEKATRDTSTGHLRRRPVKWLTNRTGLADPELVTITICCGKGEHGRLRKQALEQLAAETGFLYRDKPSISRLFEDLADRYFAGEPLPEWFLRLDEAEPDPPPAVDETTRTEKIGIRNRFNELLAGKQEREPQSRWSISAVSRATGIDRATLRAYARGCVTRFYAGALEALCAFFDCDIGDLLVLIEEDI